MAMPEVATTFLLVTTKRICITQEGVLETAPQDELESAVWPCYGVVLQLGLASHRALADHIDDLIAIPLVPPKSL